MNQFVSPYSKIEKLLRVDPTEAGRQVDRLERVKRERDGGAVAASLENLQKVARSDENTMPALIECVEARATLGEICDVLRDVFGVQREFLIF